MALFVCGSTFVGTIVLSELLLCSGLGAAASAPVLMALFVCGSTFVGTIVLSELLLCSGLGAAAAGAAAAGAACKARAASAAAPAAAAGLLQRASSAEALRSSCKWRAFIHRTAHFLAAARRADAPLGVEKKTGRTPGLRSL